MNELIIKKPRITEKSGLQAEGSGVVLPGARPESPLLRVPEVTRTRGGCLQVFMHAAWWGVLRGAR